MNVTRRLFIKNGAIALASIGLEPVLGQIQSLTPSTDALYVPNIDEALDDDGAKREFWSAFRALGQWWADLPPY